MLKAVHRLGQTGNARSSFQVAQIALYRANQQRSLAWLPQGFTNRSRFNRITHRGPGTVSL